MLEITVVPSDAAITLIALKGRMNMGSRMREIENKLTEHAHHEGKQALLIDLSEVDYIDSAGLGVLMLLFGRMKKQQGRFGLIAPTKNIMHLLELTNTNKVLKIYPDRDSALAG